jgi:putative aldouronate transport system substrate-binding protein
MKKVLAFILALACVPVGLVCGGGRAQASSSGSQMELSAPGVLPVTREKSYLDVFWAAPSYITLEGNEVLRDMEAATNVHLNLIIAQEADAREKINLLLNSGQYPEVITGIGLGFTAADQVRYGTTEKIFLPLNDLIEEHGVNTRAAFQKYPWVRESMTMPDGNIYGLPSLGSGAKVVDHGSIDFKLWMNTAWLEKLGLSKPTTTEEFRNVLRAFKTRDPNENGRADEIPLTGAQGTWAAAPYLYLLNAFGYYSYDNIMLKNDRFQPTANQDYIREGLTYIKSLYDEGLLDPAAFTQTLEQMGAVGGNAGSPIVGAFTAGHLAMAINLDDRERSRSYTALEPLRGPSGYRGLPYGGDEIMPTSASFVITDKCKNPALALKWVDSLFTEYWTIRAANGTKGVGWDDADSGTFGMDGVTPAKYKYLIGYAEGAGGTTKLQNAWGLMQVENWKGLFQVVGDIADPTNYEARLVQETLKLVPYAADVQVIPPLAYSQDNAARLSQIQAPIDDHVKASFVEFITGRRPLDTANWNAYKQELEKLGYPELIAIMQNAYDQRKR